MRTIASNSTSLSPRLRPRPVLPAAADTDLILAGVLWDSRDSELQAPFDHAQALGVPLLGLLRL